ncbi:hypothetical protein [Candidatus Tisiphia endosymbiont of Oplodontha viridula]
MSKSLIELLVNLLIGWYNSGNLIYFLSLMIMFKLAAVTDIIVINLVIF